MASYLVWLLRKWWKRKEDKILGILYSLCLMKKIRKREGEFFFESRAIFFGCSESGKKKGRKKQSLESSSSFFFFYVRWVRNRGGKIGSYVLFGRWKKKKGKKRGTRPKFF